MDDDPEIRAALIDILGDEGLRAAAVGDGVQALAWLRAHPGEASLVLLDLMMPEMDGVTFLGEKLADPQLAAIPVVVLTAGSEAGMEEVVRDFNVLQALRKPVRVSALLSAVRAGLRASM